MRGLVADAQHGGDLGGGAGAGDGAGQAGDLAVDGPGHGQRPPVAAGLGEGVGRVDRGHAERSRSSSPVGHVDHRPDSRRGERPGTAA